MADPEILHAFTLASLIYVLLLCSLVPLVSVIGWFGASLTFPLEKK